MKQRISIFILLLSLTNLLSAGFVAGTLVKTPTGYVDIADIAEGDTVVCFNFDGQCVEERVTYVRQTSSQNIYALTVSDETVLVSGDHEFYIPQEQLWVKAQDVRPGSILFANCSNHVFVDSNVLLNDSKVIYDISVEDYHNFCVSKIDIHVHNFSLAPLAVGLISTLGKLLIAGGSAMLLYFSQSAESHEKGEPANLSCNSQKKLTEPRAPIKLTKDKCDRELFIWKMKDSMAKAKEAYVLHTSPDSSIFNDELIHRSKELCDNKEEIKSFVHRLGETGCKGKEKQDIEKEYLAMLSWFKLFLTEAIIWQYHGNC